MIRVSAVFVVLFAALSSYAQVSPQDAQAKLEEKQKQRQAEREQMVQISAGELADLKAEIKRLEGDVKSLRAQLGQKDPTAAKKFHEFIEIGMTKDEVMIYIKGHSNLKLVGQAADSGIRKS